MDLALSVLGQVALAATPLVLAAVGEVVAERSGVLNIGLEGLVLLGAFASFAAAWATGDPAIGLAVGGAAGVGAAALFGWLHVYARADAIVAGTALHLAALGATAVGYDALFGGRTRAVIDDGLPAWLLPSAAVLFTVAAWRFLFRTSAGLRLRACGEDPRAARTLGIAVERVRFGAVLFGGLTAGLAGAELALVEVRGFVEEMSAGRGFLALAIVVCGRWNPIGAAVAGCAFGAVWALQFRAQALGLGLPYSVFLMAPYVVTLLALALLGRSARPPGGIGRF